LAGGHRLIAPGAGLPLYLCKWHRRAGGARVADDAGASLTDIQGALTHKTPSMTPRYIRTGPARKIEAVAEARARRRAADDGGTS
jgi:hypothetical protein